MGPPVSIAAPAWSPVRWRAMPRLNQVLATRGPSAPRRSATRRPRRRGAGSSAAHPSWASSAAAAVDRLTHGRRTVAPARQTTMATPAAAPADHRPARPATPPRRRTHAQPPTPAPRRGRRWRRGRPRRTWSRCTGRISRGTSGPCCRPRRPGSGRPAGPAPTPARTARTDARQPDPPVQDRELRRHRPRPQQGERASRGRRPPRRLDQRPQRPRPVPVEQQWNKPPCGSAAVSSRHTCPAWTSADVCSGDVSTPAARATVAATASTIVPAVTRVPQRVGERRRATHQRQLVRVIGKRTRGQSTRLPRGPRRGSRCGGSRCGGSLGDGTAFRAPIPDSRRSYPSGAWRPRRRSPTPRRCRSATRAPPPGQRHQAGRHRRVNRVPRRDKVRP